MIETLVAIAMIAILIGLLLPAVQSSREAARRARCLSHLRQLGLAVNNHASAHGVFPGASAYNQIGPGKTNYNLTSLFVTLLPQMEQRSLYDSINFNIPMGISELRDIPPANQTAVLKSISVYLCPSDSCTVADPYGPVSYRAGVGSGSARLVSVSGIPGVMAHEDIEDGAFRSHPAPTPLGSFTDGLSNTVAFSEKKIGSGRGTANLSQDWISTIPHGELTDADWVTTCSNLSSPLGFAQVIRQDGGRTWLLQGAAFTCFYSSVPPNSSIPDCGTSSGVFAARSYHPGGVNAVMADGSARWFSSSIDRAAWRALGTRNGGETISID